jgi:hypothetical protein
MCAPFAPSPEDLEVTPYASKAPDPFVKYVVYTSFLSSHTAREAQPLQSRYPSRSHLSRIEGNQGTAMNWKKRYKLQLAHMRCWASHLMRGRPVILKDVGEIEFALLDPWPNS